MPWTFNPSFRELSSRCRLCSFFYFIIYRLLSYIWKTLFFNWSSPFLCFITILLSNGTDDSIFFSFSWRWKNAKCA
jgi:hypothetical protein